MGKPGSVVLAPPPFVSTGQRPGAAVVGSAGVTDRGLLAQPPRQPLVPFMLSELAFDREATAERASRGRPSDPGSGGRGPSNPNRGEGSDAHGFGLRYYSSAIWNGLLCLSSGHDPDLFFDAQEKPMPRDRRRMDSNGRLLTLTLPRAPEKGEAANDERELRKTNTCATAASTRASDSGLCSVVSFASNDSVSVESVEVEVVRLEKAGSGSSIATGTICGVRGGAFDPRGNPHHHNPQCERSDQSLRAHSDPNPSDAGCRQQQQQQDPPPPPPAHPGTQGHNPFARVLPPPPPKELPLRFLRAGKGDPVEGQRRYEATLQWRKEHSIDTILLEAHPKFEMIKENYPHYFHLRGRQNEPVFFEQPPKTDLAALRRGGMDLHGLVRHYVMVTEFQWQFLEPNDLARSITVLDLEGMRMVDFVGECVEYVKMCSQFTGQHYPERAGHVIVVNVPRWFAMIWKVVKPMVDEVTLKKISIVRGKDAVLAALSEKIPIENIPPEYGGSSMPLGESPEERALRDLMRHNNALARGDCSCGGRTATPPCRFCVWGPPRSY